MKQQSKHYAVTSSQDELDLNLRMGVPANPELSSRITSAVQALPQIKASPPVQRPAVGLGVRLLNNLLQQPTRAISTLAGAAILAVLVFSIGVPNSVDQSAQLSEVVIDEPLKTVITEVQVANGVDKSLVDEVDDEFVWDELMLMQDELLFAQM